MGSGRSRDVLADQKNKISILEPPEEYLVLSLTSNGPTLLPLPVANRDTCLGRPNRKRARRLEFGGSAGLGPQTARPALAWGNWGGPLNWSQPCRPGPFPPSLVLPQIRSLEWVGGRDPARSRPACPPALSSPERLASRFGRFPWVHGRHRPHAAARPARVSPPQRLPARPASLRQEVPASLLSPVVFLPDSDPPPQLL